MLENIFGENENSHPEDPKKIMQPTDKLKKFSMILQFYGTQFNIYHQNNGSGKSDHEALKKAYELLRDTADTLSEASITLSREKMEIYKINKDYEESCGREKTREILFEIMQVADNIEKSREFNCGINSILGDFVAKLINIIYLLGPVRGEY
jgi:hypothetical protein